MTTRQNPPAQSTEVHLELVVQLRSGTVTLKDGLPPDAVRQFTFNVSSPVLFETIEAAQTLGLSVLVENRLEESGRPVVDVTICSDEVKVEEADIDKRWPLPQNWTRVDRVVTDDQDALFDDARWGRFAARAIYAWVRIDESGVTDVPGEEDYEWMWFADFSNAPIVAGE